LAEEAADMDPFVKYVMLGDSIKDGILAWISLGIDSTARRSVEDAVTYYEGGGVENESSGIGGSEGSSGPGGNGTSGEMPSGTAGGMPSGTPPARV